jgi:hypothetical protein
MIRSSNEMKFIFQSASLLSLISLPLVSVLNTLMMETKTVCETVDVNSTPARPIALENFIAFSRPESFKSYKGFMKADSRLSIH